MLINIFDFAKKERKTMKIKNIFLSILRSVICYFTFTFVSAYVIWCVRYMFWDKIDTHVLDIISCAVFLFTLPSVMYAFSIHNTSEARKILSSQKKRFSFGKELLLTAVSAEFVAEALIFALLTALLPYMPLELGYSNIPNALFYGKELGGHAEKLLVCGIMIPFSFLSALFTKTTARKDFYAKALSGGTVESAAKSVLLLSLRIIAVSIVYAVGFMVFPIYLGNAPAALMIVGKILPFILAALFAAYLLSYVRAFRERKKFMRELTKLCREKGFIISPSRSPYPSVFKVSSGFDITVEAHGKKYDCKFIPGVHRNSPIMFDLFGAGVWIHYFRIRGKELFKYVRRFEYAFESENKKLLLIVPAPRETFVGENGRRRPLDTGDSLGEYKVFYKNGFLRSLELDVIDAKGKFE